MTIASYLTPDLVLSQDLRLSNADITDVQYYNASAYKRMEQVFKGAQDGQLMAIMFPKATIELLTMLEEQWWPKYGGIYVNTQFMVTKQTQPGLGKLTTGFEPAKVIKQNQFMIELEVFKVIANFYDTLVTDNANVNTKDAHNSDIARKRFNTKWTEVTTTMSFYDTDADGFVDKLESNQDVDEANANSADRRYF